MRTLRHVVLAAALAVTAAGACGGGGDGDGDSDSDSVGVGTPTSADREEAPVDLDGEVTFGGRSDIASSGSAATLDVELSDKRFTPTYVKVAPGAKVHVRLENRGEVPHTFTIAEPAIDVPVDPGDSTEIDVALPASGVVRFACRFHQSTGMQGAFYFTEGESAGGDGDGYPGPTSGSDY